MGPESRGNTQLPVDGANRRHRCIKEDKGICSTDRHMTGMSYAERHKDVLERVGGAGPLSDMNGAIKKREACASRSSSFVSTMFVSTMVYFDGPLSSASMLPTAPSTLLAS